MNTKCSALIAVLFLVAFLAGCAKTDPGPLLYPDAVIHGECRSGKSAMPVKDKLSGGGGIADEKGHTRWHYEYVGGVDYVPVKESADESTAGDMYVFRIQMREGEPWHMIPFIYTGGDAVVYDKDEVKIWITQE